MHAPRSRRLGPWNQRSTSRRAHVRGGTKLKLSIFPPVFFSEYAVHEGVGLDVPRSPRHLFTRNLAWRWSACFCPAPLDLTSPLCHSRHLRPGSPSCPSPEQASNTGASVPPSRPPAFAGSPASTAPGPDPDGDTGFAPAASDLDGEINTPTCRPGIGAAVARASALPSSRSRPSASSVAAGTSRVVTGVLGCPERKHEAGSTVPKRDR